MQVIQTDIHLLPSGQIVEVDHLKGGKYLAKLVKGQVHDSITAALEAMGVLEKPEQPG